MSEDQFEIRSMRDDELDCVVALWQRSFDAGEPRLLPEQRHTRAEEQAFFRGVVAVECELWVALRGVDLLGLLALKGREIDRLYVEPDAQRVGVGSALIEHAKRLRPKGLVLVTLQRNDPARRFYERHGFLLFERGFSPPPENEPDVWYRWSGEKAS